MKINTKDLDGWLYIGVAVTGALAAAFASDEAAKYIGQPILFYLKTICTVSSAGFLAAKMYRSTTFADNKTDAATTTTATTQTVVESVTKTPVTETKP